MDIDAVQETKGEDKNGRKSVPVGRSIWRGFGPKIDEFRGSEVKNEDPNFDNNFHNGRVAAPNETQKH